MSVTLYGSGQNVLQVVTNTLSPASAYNGTSSGSYVTTGLNASITPSSSSNKILCLVNFANMFGTNNYMEVNVMIYRTIGNNYASGISGTGLATITQYISTNNYDVSSQPGTIIYLDSPATTLPVYYEILIRNYNNASPYVYPTSYNSTPSTIQLLEISQA
jgi:hypothetical protein